MENTEPFKISLKAARINAGLNIEEVCKMIGRNKNTLSSWESGKTNISVNDFVTLCKIYKIPESMVKQN